MKEIGANKIIISRNFTDINFSDKFLTSNLPTNARGSETSKDIADILEMSVRANLKDTVVLEFPEIQLTIFSIAFGLYRIVR
jgi:hypothetical protein